MLVTFTNASGSDRFVSALYTILKVGSPVTTRRSFADLDQDQNLKGLVASGLVTLAFTLEVGDQMHAGASSSPLHYTNVTRPAANTVPVYTAIWNDDDNAMNWSEGVNWRDAMGVIT